MGANQDFRKKIQKAFESIEEADTPQKKRQTFFKLIGSLNKLKQGGAENG